MWIKSLKDAHPETYGPCAGAVPCQFWVKTIFWGVGGGAQNDRTGGRELALYTDDTGLIQATLYGSPGVTLSTESGINLSMVGVAPPQ